jgi:hypothetical protein
MILHGKSPARTYKKRCSLRASDRVARPAGIDPNVVSDRNFTTSRNMDTPSNHYVTACCQVEKNLLYAQDKTCVGEPTEPPKRQNTSQNSSHL